MICFFAELRRVALGLSVAAACSLGLAACSTTGNDFDSSALRLIVPGQTSLAEASSLLKADPVNVYRQQDGSGTAIWSHKTSMLTDAIYLNQELWLAFGPDDRFLRVIKTKNLPRASPYSEKKPVDAAARQTQAGLIPASSALAVQAPATAAPVIPAPAAHMPAGGGKPAAPSQDAPISGAMYKPAISYPLSP